MNQAEVPTNVAEWTVSDLAGALKRTLEDRFGHVRLRGEISNYRGPHSSGHAYFCLKDQNARIDAVIWKTAFNRLRIKPQEGLEVVATGRITTFPGKSTYQIVIDTLEPAGIGALMALLDERKRQLAAQGLFAAERKRALPFLPRVIGVVTSPTGAVIRDILHRLEDRFPRHVLVWPARVQGDTCAAEVAAGIRGLGALGRGIPRPDVIIVARGGGSLEDLWGFNDELVVRAAAESPVPVVSAVGHETDWTLIDLAADVRAPTPTGAAEMVVPVRSELLAQLNGIVRRHGECMLRGLEHRRTALRSAARALPTPEALLASRRQRLDLATARLKPALARSARVQETRLVAVARRLAACSPAARLAGLRGRFHAVDDRPERALARIAAAKRDALRRVADRLAPALAGRIERRRDALAAVHKLFLSLGHAGVLARGYALVRDEAGAPIRSAAAVGPGQALAIELADGTVRATAAGAAPPRRKTGPAAPQPSLFET
ncbi:MAG TPA: exodeoxyribonuclease VII large subunit [Beijerinckiaceae bacterium]|nr:exodeoxyribonuclease VII large subunit [Beijerinckiaceae bacterium]